MRIIDITQELFSCRVYPGDMAPSFERARRMPKDAYNLTNIALSVHNGTHADAPLHFIQRGEGIDAVKLDVFYGICTVAEIPSRVTEAVIAPFLGARRLLLKGGPDITPEAAGIIANSKIRLLGVESQSVGAGDATLPVHVALLGAGIILLEGLDLSRTEPGQYTLAAFPLKLAGCEGSPVRAVLIDERPH
jgi:arylformamidase